MKLIESKTLGTAAASIEFTSIPQDGTDLVLVFSSRMDLADNFANTFFRFNGDTGSNYSMLLLFGLGSGSPGSVFESNTSMRFVYSSGANSTSNTFSNGQIYIPNYTGATAKSVSMDSVSENNATAAIQALAAGRYSGTSAITSLTFLAQPGSNLVAGTMASLYKITKGSDGIVTTS